MSRIGLYIFLIIGVAFFECAPKSGSERINKHIEEHGPIVFDNELELCNLIPKDIIEKYVGYQIPEFKNISKNYQNYSQYGVGCMIEWNTDEKIKGKQFENYLHALPEGGVEAQVLSNYDENKIENWSNKILNNFLEKNERRAELGVDGIEYREVTGIGDRAIWSDGFSTLKWHVNNQVIFSLKISYPLPEEERLQMAIEMGDYMVDHLIDYIDK